MKSAAHLVATASHATARSRPLKAQPSDEFISLAETRSLLATSLPARQQRLDAGDMVSTDEAAEMTGTSRVTVNAWIAKGRAIGLTQAKRGYRLPRWQFDSPMWDVLPKLARALDTSEGWALVAFLETPHGALSGATPREAIERGNGAKVVELASQG